MIFLKVLAIVIIAIVVIYCIAAIIVGRNE